jgi:SpoIVB peptidase S55
MKNRSMYGLCTALLAVCTLTAAQQAPTPFLPVADIRPGMTGVGRTVFAGEAIEEFKVNILGVLHNIIGPGRNLILAKLEGGPLAMTGVIAGMSGSPVFVDGKLVGAVSYSLGSFPKEPFAGITPIEEITAAINSPAPRMNARELALNWPATPTEVFSTLHRLAERAAAPLRTSPRDADVFGPAGLADLAPSLRPIAAAMVMNGFEPSVSAEIREALAIDTPHNSAAAAAARARAAEPLRPGDPVGVTLIRGDLEMGATGTVTHVDGSRVYAFGHPFLNLGPTEFAMTQAHVYAVLPSLDSSLKIATMGPVIGTMQQDRSTGIGGTLGPGPREVAVNVTLSSEHAPERKFTFRVLHDQLLTPLFSYVSVLNSLGSYERQTGVLSIAAQGAISFGKDGHVTVDDFFSGEGSATLAAAAATAPVGVAAGNEFRAILPESIDLHFTVSERQESSTIERVWLDTTKPRFGQTHTLQVLLQNFRGSSETISVPIKMPTQAAGPLTLLVADGPTLTALEKSEVKPGKPTNLAELIGNMNSTRRNNRVYVRLLTSTPGAVVSGHTLPSLPSSVRSVLDADKSVSSVPLSRSIVGTWEQRVNRTVKGSREITITLSGKD